MKVIWTRKAEQTHTENLDYLQKEWPKVTLLNYLNELENSITRIAIKPNLFPAYNKKSKIHKCVIHKNITLYYQIKETTIYLLVFWNNHQNPKNLNL